MDLTWEDIVNQVVIPGEPEKIHQAADAWHDTLVKVRVAKHGLDDGLRGLASAEGASADAFRQHVGHIAHRLGQFDQRYDKVEHHVRTAGDSLKTAMATIPIPVEMAGQVEQLKANYRVTLIPTGLAQDSLFQLAFAAAKSRFATQLQTMLPDQLRRWQSELRDSLSPFATKAKAAYSTLNTQYGNVHAGLPEPSSTPPTKPFVEGNDANLGFPGGSPGPGGVPSLGAGGAPAFATTPVSGRDPFGGVPGAGGPDAGDWDVPGTGLAGSGGSGLGGLAPTGLDPSSGVGRGGGAAGGLPAGVGRGGVPGGLGAPMGMPMGGAPAGGARGGQSGRGGRGAGAGAGMLGGPAGAGGRGGEPDGRDSWLTEDENPWIGREPDNLVPPVLGARPKPDDRDDGW